MLMKPIADISDNSASPSISSTLLMKTQFIGTMLLNLGLVENSFLNYVDILK